MQEATAALRPREPGSRVIPLPQSGMTEAAFLSSLRATYGLGERQTLMRTRGGASQIPGEHFALYEHRLDGLVVGAEGVSVHTRDGVVSHAFGDLTGGLTLSTQPLRSNEEVLRLAEAAVQRALETTDSVSYDAQRSHACDRQIERRETGHGLVHRCQMVARRPVGEFVVVVDDATGGVLRTVSTLWHAWQPSSASGISEYNGAVGPFAAELETSTAEHRLRTPTAITMNANGATAEELVAVDYGSASDWLSPPNGPFDALSAPGVSVHWAVLQALDHLSQRFGIDPLWNIDPQLSGKPATSYVDLTDDPTYPRRAAYSYAHDVMIYTDFTVQQVAVDIVGHELTHQLLARGGLKQDLTIGEYGALVESFADILGELVEETVPGGADWIQGAVDPAYYRVLYQPALSLPPGADVYQQPPWIPLLQPTSLCTPQNDHCGLHVNSGVQSLWFHLLAFSGQGTNSANTTYDVVGVGVDTAALILFATIMEKLPPGNGYPQAAIASESVAKALCGDFSQASVSTHNAWHATGLHPTPITTAPWSDPADNEGNVAPFAATLKWIRALGSYAETDWEVQFSPDPTFPPSSTDTYTTLDTGFEGTLQVGILESPSLAPNTTYYWRLRPTATALPNLDCWRPIKRFKTSAAVPQPISPDVTEGRVHPWLLPFKFTQAEGATAYQIQVAYGETLDQGGNPTELVFPTLTFPASMVEGNRRVGEVEITVPVDERLVWRVRAEDGLHATPYSAFEEFVTDLPEAQALAPSAPYPMIDPWPVTFTFKELKGAEHTIQIVDTSGHHDYAFTIPTEEANSVSRNLPGDGEIIWKWWLEKPLGPTWGSALEPVSQREHGIVGTGQLLFRTDGNLTQVDSSSMVPAWPACVGYQDDVTLSWSSPHPEAATYRVQAHELFCPPPLVEDPSQPTGPCAQVALVLDQSGIADTHLVSGAISGPTSDKDHPGYRWSVQAFTSDGVPGWAVSSPGGYFVQPTTPDVLSPSSSSLPLPEGGVVDFTWESDNAHGGNFVLTVYDGEWSVLWSEVILGNQGGTGASVGGVDWQYGETYHWTVTPWAYDPCFSVSTQGSFSFLPPPPPPAPELYEFSPGFAYPGAAGQYPDAIGHFKPALGAVEYEIDVRLCSYVGDDSESCWNADPEQDGVQLYPPLLWSEQDLQNAYNYLALYVNQNLDPGWFFPGPYFFLLPSTDPLNHYFLRAQACNAGGCSGWSPWAHCGTGYP